MEDEQALRKLRRGDPKALEALVVRYTPYVSAAIRNQLGGLSTEEDVEELCADVFFTLWEKAGSLRTDRLRGWLGMVARNEARSLLRQRNLPTAPEEEVILAAGDDLEADVLQREQDRFIREAVLAMGQPDREIFLRHYYYNQKCKEIAAALDKFVYLRKKAGHRSVPGLFLCLNSSQFRLRSPGPFRCNGAPAPASYP